MTITAEQAPIRLNADFSQIALMRAAEAEWTPSPAPGVTRRMLDRIGGEQARVTSLVRYAPRSRFPEHVHDGGEEFFVLEGVFSDATGDFGAGTYVRNPPGTRHAPWTNPGCVILVKLRQMRPEDDALVRAAPEARLWEAVAPGVEGCVLFDGPAERVELARFAGDGEAPAWSLSDGAELLVLEGEVQSSEGRLARHDWLRSPPGVELRVRASGPALVWVKTGHLRAPIGV